MASAEAGSGLTCPRRHQLMIHDDPSFDLSMQLPAFPRLEGFPDLDGAMGSQSPRKEVSQLSPLMPDDSVYWLHEDLVFDPMDLDGALVPAKPRQPSINLGKIKEAPIVLREDEEYVPAFADDWGIVIDAEGNVLTVADEPELPALPKAAGGAGPAQEEQEERHPNMNDEEVVPNLDNGFLPDAEAFPAAREQNGQERVQGMRVYDVPMAGQARRVRRRRPDLITDDKTNFEPRRLKAWSTNYLANMEQQSNKKKNRPVTAAEARRNARHLIFGRGIADVGVPIGTVFTSAGFEPTYSPLVADFGGERLEALFPPRGLSQSVAAPRGQRRPAAEAVDTQDEANRRVRPRLSLEGEHKDQPGSAHNVEDLRNLPGEAEMGREAGTALPDLLSDAPWNGFSSQVPSSSVKGGRHAGPSRQISTSPIRGRGNLPSDIERYSDQPVLGSDGINPLNPDKMFIPYDLSPAQEPQTSQNMQKALDRGDRSFLGFTEEVARDKGETRPDGTRWVEFDELVNPETATRAEAVRAFFQVLSLATKDAIKVEQDEGVEPHGAIRVAVKNSAAAEDEMPDL